MSDFQGQTVLVTGASKGIGRACVEKFAQAGARVFFTFRTEDHTVKTLSEIATPICADACELEDYNRLLTQISALDILINNAGDVLKRSSFENSSDDLWISSLDVNLLSAIRATRTFLPQLKQSSRAVIVNVSSIAALHGGAGDSMHYGVAKAGMNAFTTALAKEVPSHIRVVGVGPSAIDTDFQKKHSSKARLEKITDQTPVGRIGTPEEVADMIMFLASEACGFVSGETIQMTGGR